MKKKYIFLLTIFVLVIAACGTNDSKKEKVESDKYQSSEEFLRISSGPMGSGWYAMTASFSELWMDNIDGLNVSQIEGGGFGNLHVVNDGVDAKMGISYSPELVDALNGIGEFEGDKKENISAVGSLTPVINYFVVDAKHKDINNVEDLLSKKVFLGPRDSGGTISLFRVLEEYDITEETFEENGGSLHYGSWADGASQLGDGIVDAWFGASPPGEANTSIAEIDISNPVKMIGFDEDKLKSIEGKGVGLSYTSGGDIYSGQEEEQLAFVMETVLFVSNDLDEEFIYNLSDILWNNIDELGGLSENRLSMLSLDTSLNSLEEKDLHPGVVKFMKEVGELK